ncbi:MAG: Gfo/Idh/MocA family oxidoreductase [Sphingomicrobium sp.]
MRIFTTGRWQPGFLDQARAADEVRIAPLMMRSVARIDDFAFVRHRDVRLLWNYWREVGLRGVVRRVRSRLAEEGRNEKWLSCGIGRVIEAAVGSMAVGELVRFITTAAPSCAERLCVPAQLVEPADGRDISALPDMTILKIDEPVTPVPAGLRTILGWTSHSGEPLSGSGAKAALAAARRILAETDWAQATLLPVDEAPVATATADARAADRAILLGYGNYAKTVIIPNLGSGLGFTRVHEIDPTQIGARPPAGHEWSTEPALYPDDRPQAVFIAGYHHSHAALAIDALGRGAAAVVEKPLVTTREQLTELLAAVASNPRYFACFHKRFAQTTAWATTDLDRRAGEPIDYHCLVYEVPLPARHWYRWPNSRSRLVSNGCHWLDHFLYLNGFAPVRRSSLWRGARGTLNAMVELDNDAAFTMALTDEGSSRTGVRDQIELRAGQRTVRITDSSHYSAESDSRILRRARVDRGDSYARMYRSISERVVAHGDGDSLVSIDRSAGLVLDLEDQLIALGDR